MPQETQLCIACNHPLLIMGVNARCIHCGLDLFHDVDHLHYRILKPGDVFKGWTPVPPGTLLVVKDVPAV